jgi:hypothetical protein
MNASLTRRSFLGATIGAMACYSVAGCGQKGTNMNNAEIESASKELGKAIVACMVGLRERLDPGSKVYAVVLVVLDDFNDLQLYANTDRHLAETDGTNTNRWYFGEFWSEGMSVDFDALTNHLGEVEDWDEDEEPERSNAVDWLAAMTHAMRHARDQGAFTFDGQEATIYCSMVDSLNAIWLEDLSARFLNTQDAYAAAAPGIKAAALDWYRPDGKEGSSAFRDVYESRL